MLTSLFGDLGPPEVPKPDTSDDSDSGFEATAIMETVATAVNARGQMVDRHSQDLVVTGSPAQAIRDHFADTRSDLDTATSLIALLDPAGVWATAVIKALSDAGGRPIERLHLRERSTLRTLATIERTTLARRDEEPLRIYHADVRAPGSENAAIPMALMERSQLAAVIIGPLQPHTIDALLSQLQAATMLTTWRCPNLLFMLPPNAVWIANKIGAMAWPGRLQVQVLSESMTGASSVWNALLGVWNQVKPEPGWEPSGSMPLLTEEGFPIKVGALAASLVLQAPAPAPAQPRPAALDPTRARLALGSLLALEGLLGAAIAEVTTGLVLARENRDESPIVDMDRAAAACAQVLNTQRHSARQMGLPEPADEMIVTAGPRQCVMRPLPRHPGLFVVMLVDKHRTNLALARFQMRDVERALF